MQRASHPAPFARRSASSLAAAAVLALTFVTPLTGHDFWLIPLGFQVDAGAELVVLGQTSSAFPSSLSAVTVDRVASAQVIGASGREPVRDLSVAGNSLRLRHRPGTAGQKIVAVAIHPRSVRESPAAFQNYLVVEGAPEALERLRREGRVPSDSVTRRYAKYAKSLVTAGQGGPAAWDRTAGHPLEFIPVSAEAPGPGTTWGVRLLFRGRPMAGARVHAGAVALGPMEGLDGLAGTEQHAELLTDAQGLVSVPITRPGLWNLRTLQIVEADAGSGADWDTHWATLVFEVKPGASTGSPDSLAVVAAVDAYHAALTRGDSSAVDRLLAPEALILESGGVETRVEYLGGHLRGDIAFAQGVPRQRGAITVRVRGDVAWATSTSVTQGEYRGRDINSASAELMVLERAESGWRIAAIHWSSRARR
jgi:ketosteroid isomerase-like protein